MLPRLWLLVGSDWPTDRPTDRQCQLLSCPGQLKIISYKLMFWTDFYCISAAIDYSVSLSLFSCSAFAWTSRPSAFATTSAAVSSNSDLSTTSAAFPSSSEFASWSLFPFVFKTWTHRGGSSNFELYEDYLHSTSGVEFCKNNVLSCERSCLLLLQLVEIKHLHEENCFQFKKFIWHSILAIRLLTQYGLKSWQ